MKKLHLLTLVILIIASNVLNAQTIVIDTNFDDYALGNLDGQTKWDGGTAEVVTTADYIKEGKQGVKVSGDFELDYLAYTKDETGLSEQLYMDCWVKLVSSPVDEYFQITGRDLTPNNSDKRHFMVEFMPIDGVAGDVRVYNGSSKTVCGSYALGEWVRISFSVDYGALTYDAALNGTIVATGLDFRESYDASERGRATDTKEFHVIRYMFEEAIADVAIGSVYVGTNPIADIAFAAPATTRTINVDQPEKGEITLSPVKADNVYELGDVVTVTCTNIADHYMFDGWTGGISGTDNPYSLTVDATITIGADVIIDPNDPPTEYTIDITQTTGGTVTVSPDEGPYYEGDVVRFRANSGIGYNFTSWNGITGSDDDVSVTLSENLTVSAVFTAGVYSPRTINVSSVEEFEDAVNDLQPGDHIIVADGNYDGFGDNFDTKGGTEEYPVLIEAETIGGVKITGDGRLSLENSAYITFKGFDFDVEIYTLFKLTDCNNIRITQNTFKNAGSGGSKLILIGGEWDGTSCASHHNRIDHNLFDGKQDKGAWVVIDGSHGGGDPQVSQYDRIDHNHFRFNQVRMDNEKETIRVGMSDLSLSSAFCTVENNLFEECDGDPEIISVKSCDNYIRNNTFVKCLGTVSLRHGNRTEVSGNYFLGQNKTAQFDGESIGCGGVRIYGKDHKVFNNYFEGLTGSRWDAALTLTQGDALNEGVDNGDDLTKHYVVENLEFTHNTMVNCSSDIEIGYRDDWGKDPINCLVANNIIVQDANPVTTVHFAGTDADVHFENNIIYTSGTGSWGDIAFEAGEALNVNPGLVLTSARVDGNINVVPTATYKLSNTSVAIDPTATVFSYVTMDSEGQPAIGLRDLGADEFNGTDIITNGVLDASHVGPDAVDFVESTSTDLNPLKTNEKLAYAYPNPFIGSTKIVSKGKTYVSIYTIGGQFVEQFEMMDSYEWTAPSSGIFLLNVRSAEGSVSRFKLVAQ